MLGKLFKLKSLQNVGPNMQAHDLADFKNGDLPRPINSFEDSYTREILYGNLDFSISPVPLNNQKFRLIISQDGGNLRAKQVLYDSSLEAPPASLLARDQATSGRSTPMGSGMASPPLANSISSHLDPLKVFSGSLRLPPLHITQTTPKSWHNINDLNDYMFGRGLPSSERTMATKIHLLPHFSSYRCVLISNLFLISDSVAFNPETDCVDGHWNPRPVLPAKELCLDTYCKSPGSFDSPTKTGFNSRFSIGFIIPLEDPGQSVGDAIAPFWTAISYQLIVLQSLVAKKLLLALKAATVHNICPYINNRRVLLPKGFLQSEHELSSLLQKLIRLVTHSVNCPRILNINSVMAYALLTHNLAYKSKLVNWALEVINWLEFKDGRGMPNSHFNNGSSFSSVHPQISNSLATSVHNSWADKTFASSTFLASLLALVLPLRQHLNEEPLSCDFSSSAPKHVARIVIMTSNSVVAKKLVFILSGVIPNVQFCSEDIEASVASNAPPAESYYEKSNVAKPIDSPPANASSPLSGHEDLPELVKPIPIRSRSLPEDDGSDCASLSVSSKLGWEVPTKSVASVSFCEQRSPNDEVHVTTARLIPSSQRLNNSTSIAYLSSSLNSSLSSSASNYSLSKLGSSFMEKWRGSLVGSSKSGMPGFNFDSMDGALAHDVLSEKPFFISARSPSPGFEYDGPIWEDSALPLRPLSPGRRMHKCVVADDKPLIKSSSSGDALPSVNIDRAKLFIYSPNRGDGGLKEKNAALIKSKLADIMTRKTSWAQDGHTIRIKAYNQGSDPGGTQQLMRKVQKNVVLNPNVAFVDGFRPENIMQSCPANPRLETQIMSAMKNDLLFHHNNCGKEQVTSTTVFISLRAREIKLIELSVGGKNDVGPTTPKGNLTPPVNVHLNKVSGSPVTSYFSGIDAGHAKKERKPSGAEAYRTTIKKVFSPHKNSGNRKVIGELDAKLEKLTEIVSLINNNSDSSRECRENLDSMFYNCVRDILE